MMGEHKNTYTNTPAFKPWKFLLVFLAVFFVFAVLLFAVDFVPEAPGTVTTKANEIAVMPAAQTAAQENAQVFPIENPVRIVAATAGIDTDIQNPDSTDANVLDNALLKGAVRYPASGVLGENARMYIFGHQSYLPIVHNQAFKAFNGLQKLKVGDDVTVYSDTAAYHYRVSSVTQVKAADGEVELGTGARTLTLSTCDSFGTKEDRNVVTAEFVSRVPLSSPS